MVVSAFCPNPAARVIARQGRARRVTALSIRRDPAHSATTDITKHRSARAAGGPGANGAAIGVPVAGLVVGSCYGGSGVA